MHRLKLMIASDLRVRSAAEGDGPKHIPCLPRKLADLILEVRPQAFGQYADLMQRLKLAGEWSKAGLMAGIEDFLILSEMKGSISSYAKLENLWLDRSRLEEFDSVARALEISLYTRIMLESYSNRFSDTTPRRFVQDLLSARVSPKLGFIESEHFEELCDSLKNV